MDLTDKVLIKFLFSKNRELSPAEFNQKLGLRGFTKASSKKLRKRFVSLGIIKEQGRRRYILRR